MINNLIMKTQFAGKLMAGVLLGAGFFLPQLGWSHCDTMDGPVVQAAKAALVHQEVGPVLKWVKPEHEPEIKAAFAQTLIVRAQSPEARALADRFFFETVVRLHRAGEGAPFTGLKPAGTALDPAVEAADHALESGSVEKLIKVVADETAAGIRQRYAAMRQTQQAAEQSVEAGRKFVAAYINYVHYVEGLHLAAEGPGRDTAGTP